MAGGPQNKLDSKRFTDLHCHPSGQSRASHCLVFSFFFLFFALCPSPSQRISGIFPSIRQNNLALLAFTPKLEFNLSLGTWQTEEPSQRS